MTKDNSVNISGGKVQGFIEENHGTVNQNFIYQVSDLISSQAPSSEKSLTKLEYRQRSVLLSKVKKYWIEGVLENSLDMKQMIEFTMEERLDAVERPFSGFEELPEESRQIVPPEISATRFFNQIGEGRTLLILGEPGSGKTLTLLKIGQKLIARAEEDMGRLIPVVLNLSSWGNKRQTIAEWLLHELWSKYQVPKQVSKGWIHHQQLLLLLDGLDEVKTERQEACVQAINQFMQEHGQTEMVVCSRIADYEALPNRLELRGSIYIRSLTSRQVNRYLDKSGKQLRAVKTLLARDPALQELAKSPLMLNIITLAYQGKNMEQLSQTVLLEERRQDLFDTYIERLLDRKEAQQQYSDAQVKHWLSWLAQQMSRTSQTVFLIEEIQPTWLPQDSQRFIYSIGVHLILGLTAAVFHVGPLSSVFKGAQGLFEGLIGGIVAGIFYGLLGGVINKFLRGLVARLATGLTLGLLFGLVFWLVLSKMKFMKLCETLSWFYPKQQKLMN